MIKKVYIILTLLGLLVSSNCWATIGTNTSVAAADVLPMQSEVDVKRASAPCGSLVAYSWTPPSPTPSGVIRAHHFQDIANALYAPPFNVPAGTLPSFTAGQPIVAADVLALRVAVTAATCGVCNGNGVCNAPAECGACPLECTGCGDGVVCAPEQCESPGVGLCDAACNLIGATCSDGIQNQSEDAVDCGGPNCDPCFYYCDSSTTCTAEGFVNVGSCQVSTGKTSCYAWPDLAGCQATSGNVGFCACDNNGVIGGTEECDDSDGGGDGCDNCYCEWSADNCGAGPCAPNERLYTNPGVPGCGVSDCIVDPACTYCGDGSIQAPEQCDGGNLNGQSCASQGFDPGPQLACTGGCAFDTSGCLPIPPLCSNGIQDPGETDVDCGGGTCPCCPDGDSCGGNGDCCSATCNSGTCGGIIETCGNGYCARGAGETNINCTADCCFPCTADYCLIQGDSQRFDASIVFSGPWGDVPALPAVGFGSMSSVPAFSGESAGYIINDWPYDCQGSGSGSCSGSGGTGKSCGWSCDNDNPGTGDLSFWVIATSDKRSQQEYRFGARTNPTDSTDGCAGTMCATMSPGGANQWNTSSFSVQTNCYAPGTSGPNGSCNDGTCDSDTNPPEDYGNCPNDCPCNYDGSCNNSEDDTNCSDCGCGDGSCNFGENGSSCPLDCCSGCESDSDCNPDAGDCGGSLNPGDSYDACNTTDGNGCPACGAGGVCL